MSKEKKNKKNKPVKDVNKDFLEDLQRVQAEFENYTKRVEREKEQVRLYVKSELLLKLIQIKEDLEKSVKVVEDKGIEMILGNVKKILEEEGVSEIETIGEEFNHEMHEVVRKNGEGKISEEVQRGYTLDGKILRVAKVVIGGKNE
jgi:molecular chaperone GrpE